MVVKNVKKEKRFTKIGVSNEQLRFHGKISWGLYIGVITCSIAFWHILYRYIIYYYTILLYKY